jgi:hypothetical protein
MRGRHFWRPYVLCFPSNADSFFHTRTRAVNALLLRLGPTPFFLVAIFAWTSRLEDFGLLYITPALPGAPYSSLALPRVLHRPENVAALVASLMRERAVLCEEFVTLCDGQQHGSQITLLSQNFFLFVDRESWWHYIEPFCLFGKRVLWSFYEHFAQRG